MHRIRWAVPLALLAALTLAAPAFADHETHRYILSDNGRQVRTVEATSHDGWTAQIAVDTHTGRLNSSDDPVNGLRSVGRVSKGPGAVRVQVDVPLRLGDTQESIVLQNDYNLPNQHALTPRVPINSGTASRALAISDWYDTAPASPACNAGSEVRTRGYFSVRWADGTLDRYTLLSEDFTPDC